LIRIEKDPIGVEFQDNNIFFALDVIKFDIPGVGFGVTGSEFDNFIVNEFSILAEFEPGLLTNNIGLFCFNSVAITEIEFLSSPECVLITANLKEIF